MAVIRKGGQLVRQGTFFSVRSWEFITIPRPGGYLPGTREQLYLRMPVVLVLLLGPLMGLLFVILLPLVGILAIPVAIGRAVYLLARWLRRAAVPAPAEARRGRTE